MCDTLSFFFFTGKITRIKVDTVPEYLSIKISSPWVYRSLSSPLTLNTYVAPPPPPPPPFTWVLFTIGPLCSWQILFSMPLACREGETCQLTQEFLFTGVSCVWEGWALCQTSAAGESQDFSIIMASEYWAKCIQYAHWHWEARTNVPFKRQFQCDLICCLHECKCVILQ